MGCALLLGLVWLAVALPKLIEPEWFNGKAVSTYLAKVVKVSGPADRPFMPIVDLLLYSGGVNRILRLAAGASAAVAAALFLAEVVVGASLVLGVLARKRRLRWAGLLSSGSLCLILGLSGASRLTAVLFALAVAALASEASVDRPPPEGPTAFAD